MGDESQPKNATPPEGTNPCAYSDEDVLEVLGMIKAHGHGELLISIHDHQAMSVSPMFKCRKEAGKKSRLEGFKF